MRKKSFLALSVILLAPFAWAASDVVVVRVNDQTITQGEIEQYARQTGATEDAAAREELISKLIDLKLLTQQAQAESIVPPPDRVAEQLGEIKANFESQEAFEKALKASGTSEPALREDIERGLMVELLIARHAVAQISPGAVEEFYKANTKQFDHPDEVRVSHILFRTPPNKDEGTVRKRAEEALARIRGGADFDQVSREVSADPESIQNNGDLGYIRKGDMPKAFTDVAFKLKPGAVSAVVKTDFGFHILKVVDKRAAGISPLDQVRTQIETLLAERETEKLSQEYLAELRRKAKIQR